MLNSDDWSNYLVATEPGLSNTAGNDTDRRIRQVCAWNSPIALLSCAGAKILPVLYTVCVPSMGIEIACESYNIQQAVGNDDDGVYGPEPPPGFYD